MSLVDTVDYQNKRIYLSAATADTNLDTLAIYKEVRNLRRVNEGHRMFKPMIIAGGNLQKIPGVSYTPAYVQLLYGCRIVPYNGTHKLKLVRETFTDDGLTGRDCFDRTPLSPAVEVDIDVDFPEIEIRQVSVNGNEYTLDQISTSVLTKLLTSCIPTNVKKINDCDLVGDGTPSNPWGVV